MSVTLNCDMGEGFSNYSFGADEALMGVVDLANVACGFHGSDFMQMDAVVGMAAKAGVRVGAHPSLPDLQGFGRRAMAMTREEVRNSLIYQIGALKGFLEAAGLPLNHIKPHGALYGMALREEHVAEGIADATLIFGVPVMGMPGTRHQEVFERRGCAFLGEFFADLDYDADGNLIITRHHDAVDPELAARRTRRAVIDGILETPSGDRPIAVDTVCIHSDTPNVVDIAQAVRGVLAKT
ncbi:MAG: 5-oxoprolinase subunit PxpA [Pseudomonadota bacterium]|nr:5-oxoprolinase subunit PxpA [Pseudomonadota bacterium]